MPQTIDPTRINQTNVNEEISPDGLPLDTKAAPTSSQHRENTQPTIEQSDNSPNEEVAPTVTEEITQGKEEPKLTLDDFLEVSGKRVEQSLTKTEEKVKTEEPVEEVTTVPTTSDDKTTKVVPSKQTTTRDFTGVEEADIPLFKNMSNESFAKLKPVYLEHRELKNSLAQKEVVIKQLEEKTKGVPDNIYEHPNGFILTPQFNELSQKVQTAQMIQNHWAEQLTKLREGSVDYDFLGINPQSGQFYTEKRPADKSAEVSLLTYFNHAQMQTAKQQAKLESLSENHLTKYKDAVGWIQNFERQSFSLFDKPETKQQWDKVIATTVSNFPPAFQRNPMSGLLAKALITLNNLGKILVEQQQQNGQQDKTVVKHPANGKKINPKDIKRAGPNGRDTVSTVADDENGKNNDITVDAFNRVKEGY